MTNITETLMWFFDISMFSYFRYMHPAAGAFWIFFLVLGVWKLGDLINLAWRYFRK